MQTRHRTKAFVGVGCWFAVVVAFVAVLVIRQSHENPPFQLSRKTMGTLLWVDVFTMLACFFWAAYHLARAKGYPGALALFGLLGPPAQLVVLTALFIMEDKYSRNPARRMTKKRRPRYRSNIERIVISRRNAVVGIVFGLGGIAAGVILVLFRLGIFADHENETSLGMFVFICGYCGVLTGCWWWLKAKDLNDAIVFIGLMPLGVLFVPFVRLIFLASPAILPVSMVMMPIILIVVVSVLPDKSGWVGRKRWRLRDQAGLRAGQPEQREEDAHR